MSIKSELYHTVICDEPDCGVSADEGSEYSSWRDIGQAYDVATNGDWAITDNDGDYCPEHSFYLESEDGYDDKWVPLHSVPFDLQVQAAVESVLYRANRQFDRARRKLGQAHREPLVASGGWCAPADNLYTLPGRVDISEMF